MNNSLTIERLANNPLLAYSISIPEPRVLELTPYESQAFPAILGNFTGLSMARVIPKFKMGRVLSFDAFPRREADPIIIYSPCGDLKDYYSIWSNVLSKGLGWRPNKKIEQYDNSIKKFIESASELSVHEITFAIIEMLKFKNDVILNF
jgi:hypothetical protein